MIRFDPPSCRPNSTPQWWRDRRSKLFGIVDVYGIGRTHAIPLCPSSGQHYYLVTVERMTAEQIAEEALALPSEARAQLADRLVESLDPAEDSYVRRLWAAEALRRRDEIRDGRVQAVPGDEVLARVRQALGR